MDKLKVAVICHVSNAEIRQNLDLESWTLKRLIKKILGRRSTINSDYSVWNTLMFHEFEAIEDIDFHAIILHPGMKYSLQEFDIRGIHYHCIKQDMETFSGKVFKNRNIFKCFWHNRKWIARVIDDIQPDVINLIAAESPFISLAGIDIDTTKYPFMVSMQTALSDPDFIENYPMNKVDYERRCEVEQAVLRRTKYIATDSSWYRAIAKQFNPGAEFLRYHFCVPNDFSMLNKNIEKEYDFVYFSNNINKAGDDAVKAFAIAHRQNPSLTLNMVGGYDDEYYTHINMLMIELGVKDNVTISGYYSTYNDALQQVLRAHNALIPIKVDIISGTIREAMMLGIPVVTYATKGTPALNKEKKTILLSSINDYKDIANNMLRLVSDSVFREELIRNSEIYCQSKWDSRKNMLMQAKTYHCVYRHFHQKTPLPNEVTECLY